MDFGCCSGLRLRVHQRAMKTDEVYDRPLETFGAATFGVSHAQFEPKVHRINTRALPESVTN